MIDPDAVLGLSETLELKADDELGDDVDVTEIVRFPKKDEAVADAATTLDLDVATLEVVVKFARRLEAEADDELGAAVDTPTLSALMISAAFQERQH